MIINNERNRLPSTISLQDFGKAMAQLDLSSVPSEKRQAAIMDHFATIMKHTVTDPNAVQEIAGAQFMHRARHSI